MSEAKHYSSANSAIASWCSDGNGKLSLIGLSEEAKQGLHKQLAALSSSELADFAIKLGVTIS